MSVVTLSKNASSPVVAIAWGGEPTGSGSEDGNVLEDGWPPTDKPNGKAVASAEDEKIAVTSHEEKAPGHVSHLAYRSDGWKSPGIEQNFGYAVVK